MQYPAQYLQQHKTTPSRPARCAAEFLGTFFLVFTMGCGVHTYSIGAVISVGAMLCAMVYALGSVSGSHFNPAVTLAVFASGRNKINLTDALYYMLSQAVAGIVATFAYTLLVHVDHGLIAQPGGVGANPAFAVEAIYSAALCYVVLNVSTTRDADPSAAGNAYFGLAVGWTLTSALIAIGRISSCGLNPAVGLGSVAASRGLSGVRVATVHFWAVAIFAPFVGALLAAAGFFAVQGGLDGKGEYGEEKEKPVVMQQVRVEEPDLEAPIIQAVMAPTQVRDGPVRLESPYAPIALDPEIYGHELCCEIAWWTKEGSWNTASDLDITCVTFDRHANHKSHVGFDCRQDKNGIKHGGDQYAALIEATQTPRDNSGLTPRNFKSSESILFKLSSVKANVHCLFFAVSIFSSGRCFDQVQQIHFRILDSATKKEVCYFDKGDIEHDKNGLIAAMIYRRAGAWCLRKVDEACKLSDDANATYRGMEPQMKELCKLVTVA